METTHFAVASLALLMGAGLASAATVTYTESVYGFGGFDGKPFLTHWSL